MSVCICVYMEGHAEDTVKGPQCLVPQRSAEHTTERISEIKECDKDRRKKRKMKESGYRSGCNNKKRKASVSSPSLSTILFPQAILYVFNGVLCYV